MLENKYDYNISKKDKNGIFQKMKMNLKKQL